MGSNCSSRQNHKDRDSISTRSEESPSYQIAQHDAKKEEERKKEEQIRRVEKEEEDRRRSELNSSKKSHPSVKSESASSPPPVVKREEKIIEIPNYKENKIVIYICAADSQDCKVEKGVVHSEVYPELRSFCKSVNFELHIVDLHWSVQDKSSEPEELFLHELSRQNEGCFLIPLVFLNTNLGTPLLPKTLESADFQTVSGSESGKVLLKWYVLDSEAQPPCYRLLPATTHIRGLKSQDKEEKENSLKEWKNEVDSILSVMLSSFSHELRETYLTTVVEQEVQNCVLMSRELAKRCVWFSRNSRFSDVSSPGESELRRRCENLQKALKNELQENHIVHLVPAATPDPSQQPEYLKQVTQNIKKHLKSIIEGIVEESGKTQVQDPRLSREIVFHRRSAMREAQSSVNRQQLLETVFSWAGKGPIIFYGPGGSGKTTLLSRLFHQVEKLEKPKVYFRKVGLTRQSSTLVSLLQSITRQLNPSKTRRIHTVEEYARILPKCLESAAKNGEMFVIIDGLDHFRDFGRQELFWVPKILPEGCKLVLSLSDKKMVDELKETLKDSDANFIEIPNLDKSERDSILMSSILEYNHSYNPEVKNTLPESCTLPLHIKAVAWQVTWSKEYNLSLAPKNQLREQLDDMLEQLETIFGKEKIEKALCLLIGSKYGLQDSEMLDVLSSDETFHTSTTYLPWAGSCLFWSKITRHLGPFLEWSDSKTLKIRDKTLTQVCLDRYNGRMNWARETLKNYFSGVLWGKKENKSRYLEQKDKYGPSHNIRRYEELPYLMIKTDGTARSLSLDHSWIVNKICATSTNQLLEDLFLERKDDDVSWLISFLETNAEALSYEGTQFYTLLYRYFNIDEICNSDCALAGKFKELAENPPCNSLIQIKSKDSEETYYNLIRRLPESGNHVVTICTEKSEISVFDVSKCKKVRSLTGITQPTDLRMVDDKTCVVLTGRELHVYDLDKLELKTKLKGVMNQKMPYFGLHDSNHLVALSRNRMYVNLMNLESGDLVTTFKAGEDRFLNSLLVSGDGKILVCGDETQKPSPMLVWNLASRKLLYDIRIPQHEFVSRLSAITHQGNYVCFVTKEVVENSPNYLVVYDLQSGTLFKKWKPGVDTTCVEISPKEGCLVTGLADSRILVWDLITGNCRYVLRGHTSFCDSVRLCEEGRLCVSWSSAGLDRSIRIWDLSNGSLVSAFTPDDPPTACEICQSRLVVATGPRLITLQLKGPDFKEPQETEDKSVYAVS
ncbi:NACHT domain- and WD repeat-containing protein 1 [Cimex lectularius]|uniref:WD repeat-containing protein 55 homolog n=1 Tax=Cimex lectularius TaxID=79782 RepID=A0A8I6TK09_CIMLE|nr:NACHT domain- and WD repeat-containing protein 1 [Cimex lectularius]